MEGYIHRRISLLVDQVCGEAHHIISSSAYRHQRGRTTVLLIIFIASLLTFLLMHTLHHP